MRHMLITSDVGAVAELPESGEDLQAGNDTPFISSVPRYLVCSRLDEWGGIALARMGAWWNNADRAYTLGTGSQIDPSRGPCLLRLQAFTWGEEKSIFLTPGKRQVDSPRPTWTIVESYSGVRHHERAVSKSAQCVDRAPGGNDAIYHPLDRHWTYRTTPDRTVLQ